MRKLDCSALCRQCHA